MNGRKQLRNDILMIFRFALCLSGKNALKYADEEIKTLLRKRGVRCELEKPEKSKAKEKPKAGTLRRVRLKG